MRKICPAILLAPALAWAQPKTSIEWYTEGENQFNLGNFDKAIEAFKQGFALEPDESKKPIYLFNVAQVYRQANDCKNAQFFYRRFLALESAVPVAKRRKDVEDKIPDVKDRIADLEACVQQQNALSKKPPQNNLPPDGDGDQAGPSGDTGHRDSSKQVATTTEPGSGGDDGDSGSVTRSATAAPHVISARLTGGGTKVNAGDVPVGVRATFALGAGYPIAINDRLTVEAGMALTFTPVPFEVFGTGATKTGQLWGAVANGGVTYEVIPKLGVRGDLGVGALFLANVGLTALTGQRDTTGALTVFHVRGAVSADYAITPNFVLIATPVAFTYSPPKDGLTEDIKSITSIDFMLGIGYRM